MKKIICSIITIFMLTLLVGCRMVKSEEIVRVKEDTIPTEVTGADLDISKIMLDITFEDGTKALRKLDESMLVSATVEDLRKPGSHDVRVNYRDAYLHFDLEVLEKYPDVKVKFMWNDELIEERTVEKHQKIGDLPEFNKEGYRFDGWYLESFCQTLATAETPAEINENGEVIIYAHATPITFEVTFKYSTLTVVEKVLYGDKIYYFPNFYVSEEMRDGYYSGNTKVDENTIVTSDMTVELRLK